MKLSIIHPPIAGSGEELDDFLATIKQYDNRFVPENLQERCDSDMEGMMADYLKSYDIHINIKELSDIKREVLPVIKLLKKYFNRQRPDELARDYEIDWNDDFLESAQSPAYPSGHTIQAYYLAGILGDQFPEHLEALSFIAELVSQSRIDRGVHFPTDVEYGKVIAAELLAQELSGQ